LKDHWRPMANSTSPLTSSKKDGELKRHPNSTSLPGNALELMPR
jgi:hypothetical protein